MLQMFDNYNLCFYFPYEEDSGVPILFARLANEIAKTYPTKNVYVIDYPNGAIARNILPLSNIRLIPYADGVEVEVPEKVVLIQQSDVPYYWPSNLKPRNDTKLYFWNLHPRNFLPSLLPLPLVREWPFNHFFLYKTLAQLYPKLIKNLNNYVNLLLDHHALSFMDSSNYDITRKYIRIGDVRVEYLPVPASSGTSRKERPDSDIFNYCWIGRICDFKAYILLYTANKLAEVALATRTNIIYLVVGDGPLMSLVQEGICNNEYFKVEYCGKIRHADMDDFLLSKVDVVTAMGTSALEGAKLGIPTILLDYSYKKITGDYSFRWLYETKEYDLGHEITKSDYIKGNLSLHDKVMSVRENYQNEADLSYLYFENNHSIGTVVSKFINFVYRSTLTYEMINKTYFEKPLLLKYYNKLRGLEN